MAGAVAGQQCLPPSSDPSGEDPEAVDLSGAAGVAAQRRLQSAALSERHRLMAGPDQEGLQPVGHGRRLVGEDDDGSSDMGAGRIEMGPFNLFSKDVTFYQWDQIYVVYGIPIHFSFRLWGMLSIDLSGWLDITAREVGVSLIPTVAVGATMSISIFMVLIEAGIVIDITVFQASLIPTLRLQAKGGLRACLDMDLDLSALKISIGIFYQVFFCIRFEKKVRTQRRCA